ncbi:MAG: pyridoxal-phosphate dependent enzyme [Flavobacteriaceae bacterium]|nr:pyridoxal-phosphate dependent enzyme [Flavobacteriaceae bacterium]
MNKKTLTDCCKRIAPYIHRTAVLSSQQLNAIVDAEVFFKCENFQKMGAFKMRGATNAIMQLSEAQRERGVVTHSSGNFAQAVSLAAKSLDIKAYIVMPSSAPQVKIEAVRGYDGIISICEPTIEAREAAADKICKATGATFIHPSNDIDVIVGNSSACVELLEAYPDLDAVISPVGGGGLVAGTALAVEHFGTNCQVYGAEPFAVDDAYRSLESGTIESNTNTNTIADGLRTQLGDINFPIIQKGVKQIIRVEEHEIIEAMRLIYQRLKIVIEPSSAVAFAAILKRKKQFNGTKIGVILSGGNVDLKQLPF